ncbi:MAG: tetratricopeptide repeat protein [Deltaproteobacteria bacterium]|nr:tetratricopeptide repeat protein [Deltaproteobacteria bacterium]
MASVGVSVSVWVCVVLGGLGSCVGTAGTLDQARALLAQGKLKQACAQGERLVRGDGGGKTARLDAWRLWIDCLGRVGRLDEARAALAKEPEGGATFYARGLLILARDPARLPAAVKLLAAAQRAWPDEGEIAYRAGVILLADAQSKRAVALLKRACTQAPTAHCSAALAHALLDIGRSSEALAEVRKILARHPRSADIRRGRQLIKRLVRRNRHVPSAARKLFVAARKSLLKDDNAAGALAKLRELEIDTPEIPAALTLRGLAHLRLGNLGRAVATFSRAAELDHLDARNDYYLGVIYEVRRQPDAAIIHFRRALRLDPFFRRAAVALGRLLSARGKFREAAALLDRLVVLAPSHVALRLAGRAHLRSGSLAQAEAYFRRLVAREPRDFEARLRLAQVLLRLSRDGPPEGRSAALVEAREHAVEAAAIRPLDPEVKRLLTHLAGRR